MKECKTCKEYKSYDSFNKKKDGKEGLSSECRICKKEYQSKRYIIRTGDRIICNSCKKEKLKKFFTRKNSISIKKCNYCYDNDIRIDRKKKSSEKLINIGIGKDKGGPNSFIPHVYECVVTKQDYENVHNHCGQIYENRKAPTKTPKRKKRNCLKCRKEFNSSHFGNRVCSTCSSNNSRQSSRVCINLI